MLQCLEETTTETKRKRRLAVLSLRLEDLATRETQVLQRRGAQPPHYPNLAAHPKPKIFSHSPDPMGGATGQFPMCTLLELSSTTTTTTLPPTA